MWKDIPGSEATEWIDDVLNIRPESEGAKFTAEILSTGVTKKQLAKFTRLMQLDILFGISYMLGDAGAVPANFNEDTGEAYAEWGVFLLDENDKPTIPLGCLHEDIGNADPEKVC